MAYILLDRLHGDTAQNESDMCRANPVIVLARTASRYAPVARVYIVRIMTGT